MQHQSPDLFDIDHFKSVNDQHGHLCGDHVLRALAAQQAGGPRGGAVRLPADELIRQADARLYEAKRGGRNRVAG